MIVTRSVTDCTRHYRGSLFSMLIVGVFVSGYAPFPTSDGGPRAQGIQRKQGQQETVGEAGQEGNDVVAFEQYQVVTGSAKRQTVLTGFLFGGPMADFAVVHIDENGDRCLRVFVFGDGTWATKLDAKLRPKVMFVDVANIGGRDRLITHESGRLNWFDPVSATEQQLMAVTSNFKPPRRDHVVEFAIGGEPNRIPVSGEIPHVDVTRDLNNDDRDDLAVPGKDGFRVFIQGEDGTFADPVKIGPPADMSRIYGADGYRYDPWSESRIHEVDDNRDARTDLVFWNKDHFEVHHQDKRGLFAPVARNFMSEVAFDSDDLDSLASGDMTGKVLHSLADLNGDGVADLLTVSLEGSSIASKRSSYEAHFGAVGPDGSTRFAKTADVTIQSERIQIAMDRHDFDRDGHVDLMFTTISRRYLKSSLFKTIAGFMGEDIWLDLEFYRMQGRLLSAKPNAVRRIQLYDTRRIRELEKRRRPCRPSCTRRSDG